MNADFGVRSEDWAIAGVLAVFGLIVVAVIWYWIHAHLRTQRAWRRRLAEMQHLPPKRTEPRWLKDMKDEQEREMARTVNPPPIWPGKERG